ncbi:MAG TPA: acyl carrier protein [Kiritimatiellia bacterium]|nr:acyl carrier protein [Kiritimatiellia bacterium]HRZ11366.1 acyl carrier protein [Kiritimatiellia bacterium]HSA17083.1 acyl carrier protein [Kiritimatiellia bacterium]
MTREEILGKLRGIMGRTSQAKVDWSRVNEQSSIASLGIDSLAMLDLMYDLQQEFGIEFEPQDVVNVSTVGDLAAFIEGRMGA